MIKPRTYLKKIYVPLVVFPALRDSASIIFRLRCIVNRLLAEQ